MHPIRIVTGDRPGRLVSHAAGELQNYIKRLFGRSSRIVARPGRTSCRILTLDAAAPPVPETLSDQGYVLRPVRIGGRSMFQIAGGSPQATMWGVYDLIERWGVRYELHGDLFPDAPGRMALPKRPITRDPDLKVRGFRLYNNFCNNPCAWPTEDYRIAIDQLAKMRMNAILMTSRPYDPFANVTFRGARKTLAQTNFGWRVPIRPDHPGYERFVQSGDAQRGTFVSPVLDGHPTVDEACAAGQKYWRRICRFAHARGIKFIISMYMDFDPAIRDRLRQLTKPRHKTPRGKVHRIRFGIWREGADVETARCMSVSNPVYLDLLAALIQAHIDAAPEADVFLVHPSEFRASAVDCDRAWKRLDRKYGLSRIATLEQVVAEARRAPEDNADRSEHVVRCDIVTLHAMDILFNERGFDMSRARRGAVVSLSNMSPELHRFLPSILEHGSLYLASMGYMPTYVAKRMDTVRLKDPESVRISIITSLDDDNIGLIPQLTGPALRRIVEAARSAGAAGFVTRQWMHSNLLPTLHYISHAAWQRGWTTRKAYRHLFGDLCGPRAAADIEKAFAVIERVTEDLHANMICMSFPVPTMMTAVWNHPSPLPKNFTPRRLAVIARAFGRAADDLQRAARVSRPAGRGYVASLAEHARFAEQYIDAFVQMVRAHGAVERAGKARAANQFEVYDEAIETGACHMEQCVALTRQSCETFAAGIRDRNDLGALAMLNHYGLDMMTSVATLTRNKADIFHFLEQ